MVKKYNSDYTMVKIVNLHDISSIYNSDLCSKSYVQYISNDYTSDFTAYNRVQYCNKWFNLYVMDIQQMFISYKTTMVYTVI